MEVLTVKGLKKILKSVPDTTKIALLVVGDNYKNSQYYFLTKGHPVLSSGKTILSMADIRLKKSLPVNANIQHCKTVPAEYVLPPLDVVLDVWKKYFDDDGINADDFDQKSLQHIILTQLDGAIKDLDSYTARQHFELKKAMKDFLLIFNNPDLFEAYKDTLL